MRFRKRLLLAAMIAMSAIGCVDRHSNHADPGRLAALAAERDQARVELADARKRHRIAQRSIQRLVEELTDAEKNNEELRGELEAVRHRNDSSGLLQ